MIKILFKKQMASLLYSLQGGGKRKADGKKPSGRRAKWMVALLVFCYFSMGMAFFCISNALGDALFATGTVWLYYAVMGLIALCLGIFGSIFSTYTWLYKAADNDLLLSMPIPPSAILFVRMASVWLFSLIYISVVYIPAMVYCWIHMPQTFLTVLCPLLTMLLLSGIVLAVSCLLGWVVALIGTKLRNTKILTVLLVFLGLSVYYVISFNMQSLIENLVQHLDRLAEVFRENAWPLYAIGQASAGDAALTALLLAVSALAVFVTWRVLSAGFNRIVTNRQGHKKTVYRERQARSTSVSAALLRREVKRFFSSTAYMLNCGLGTLIMPALGILALVKVGDLALALVEMQAAAPELKELFPALVAAAVCMISTMNLITVPSVSLEGEQLWLIRSLPVPTAKILAAKQWLHLLLTVPPALICCICCGIAFRFSFLQILMIVLPALAFIAFISAAGLALNLKKPNLNWTNETQAIKQNVSALIIIFGGWVLVIGLGALYWLLQASLSVTAWVAICTVLFALTAWLITAWINRRGVVLFEAC